MNGDSKVEIRSWAREVFGGAELGDARRVQRLVSMASSAAQRPAGKVSEACGSDAERQGAYDFLEDDKISDVGIRRAMSESTAHECALHEYVFVAVDGSSVNAVDRVGGKDFGSVGTLTKGARGLKVITALTITPGGVPLGIAAQTWWARQNAQRNTSKKEKTKRNAKRKTEEKETRHWQNTIRTSASALNAAGAKAWFQLDREGDSQEMLLELAQTGHWFTVRSSTDRRLVADTPLYLREALSGQDLLGSYNLEVAGGPKRQARVARILVRAAAITLRLRHPWTKKVRTLTLTAVWAREQGTTPSGEEPIDWMLLTNRPIESFEDAILVIRGYAQRWRIEEFHKSWKSGHCNVEQAQLRSTTALTKWATILAAVAVRIERLKYFARQQPDQPASIELTPYEIEALLHLKRRYKKRTENIPNTMPTIADATRWIAELGGYTGKSSGGPPGAITIGRGLERLRAAADLLHAMAPKNK